MSPVERIRRAWHDAAIGSFDARTAIAALATRSGSSGFESTLNNQISVWKASLELLAGEFEELKRGHLRAPGWQVLFEYEIPRRHRRIDVVLLAEGLIFLIEVKYGTDQFDRSAIWQAEDYALELRDFHAASDGRVIIPILWATGHKSLPQRNRGCAMDVDCVGAVGLARVLLDRVRTESESPHDPIDAEAWDGAAYRPTPTIIEATQRLFGNHGVADITHSYADNLTTTVGALGRAISKARRDKERVICFVTGVPGAGKTLTGLAAAHEAQEAAGGDGNAAYLSGNGPLVQVLREALARDGASRGTTKKEAARRASTMVQNVHEFVREYALSQPSAVPHEHVVVFDEAQRAWHAEKLTKRYPDLARSEPALMLDIMERPADWAVVVALVGGGQEIHSGEAGLEEWGRAVVNARAPWRVVVSPEALRGGASVGSSGLLPPGLESPGLLEDPSLHLAVSVRSPRAKHLADWVNAVLDLRPEDAARSLRSIEGFRLGMIRDLDEAKAWLREATRGERRCGLISSSGNLRIRASGLEVSPEFLKGCSLEHWFLGADGDVRSSSALEIALTEFKIQGLEIDYSGVCWGDDLTISLDGTWNFRRFSGASWRAIKKEVDRRYLINKYRVLLTRAREGMVVFVPRGDANDPTREPARLDRTAKYLARCGLREGHL